MIRKKRILLPMSITVLVLLLACHNFYMARTFKPGQSTPAQIDSLQNENRFFVLRTGGQAFYMKNMVLSSDQKTLTTTLDSLPPDHRWHLTRGHHGNLHYKVGDSNQVSVLSEVHLFVPTMPVSVGQTVNLSLEDVQKIEVIEKDKKETTNSYVIGAVGITLGVFVVAAIIVAATKSSCPFVSAYDGKEFLLQGEIYGGAIYPQLARHDYLPLKMAPLPDGSLQLKISNELKEKQYTDFTNLLVIKHDSAVKVLTDGTGHLYTVRTPNSPVSATLDNGRNLLPALRKDNDLTVACMDDTTTTDGSSNLTMTFKREERKRKAKLVLSLKNSYWLDLLYGELAQGFGKYYATYLEKQSQKPAAGLVQWTKDQQIPLTVSLLTDNGWEKITDIATTGPLASRTIVVPVNLSGASAETVKLRLSCGFLFWELDYAGLDFSDEEAYSVEQLSPVKAIDENGADVLSFLQKDDNLFLEQPQIGNVATLVYQPKPQEASKNYTYVLHTKGWYRHVRNFTNKPNVAFLKQFKKPNAFPLYGRTRFRQIQNETLRLMAANN